MPAHATLDNVLDAQLLVQLGQRLRAARKRRGLSSAELAQQAGMSRATLSAVENGDPSPTFGTVVRVLSALGMVADLALLATGAANASASNDTSASAQHRPQDLQSLWLHEEAVKLLRADPSQCQRLLQTLDRWDTREDQSSRSLHDRWRDIIARQDWKAALARTHEGQQLRQASPLATLLPEATRLAVLARVKAYKERLRAAA